MPELFPILTGILAVSALGTLTFLCFGKPEKEVAEDVDHGQHEG